MKIVFEIYMIDHVQLINPFLGLRNFELEDAHLFFGREMQVEELAVRLARNRFLAILGSWGCGKSSLVKAGLVPAVIDGLCPDLGMGKWRVIIVKPGVEPIRNLVEELLKLLRDVEHPNCRGYTRDGLEQEFLKSEETLLNLLGFLAEVGVKLLFIIDQFEEVFRYEQFDDCQVERLHASRFVQLILAVYRQGSDCVYTVLTMRSDFLDNCNDMDGLTEAINDGHYLLPRMKMEEVRRSIVNPIRYNNVLIAERLVDRLLAEINTSEFQLPVLQHVMMRTWQFWFDKKMYSRPVDVWHYESVGTMKMAFSWHAEEIYSESITRGLQEVCEKVFKAITVSTNSKGGRKPTKLREIVTITNFAKEDIVEVIDLFRKHNRGFLLPPYAGALDEETVIDIPHESIIWIWNRLKKWVEEERYSAELYLKLSETAFRYQKGRAGLLANPELQLAMAWQLNAKPNAAWAMQYDVHFERTILFIEYSRKQFELALFNKEEVQKNELKRTRFIALFLGGASLISLLFLIFSLNLRFRAELSERKAKDKEVIAQNERLKALEQQKVAVVQRRIAQQQQKIAERQKLITLEQKKYALKQQRIAIIEKEKAIYATYEAIKARDKAHKQQLIAEKEKEKAEREREKAERSEQYVRQLRKLAVSKTIATKSLQLAEADVDLRGLLALQAYNYMYDSRGSVNDPDVYNALAAVADVRLVFAGHKDVVREISLFDQGREMISCSDDGTLRRWDLETDNAKSISLPLPKRGSYSFRTVATSKQGEFVVGGTLDGRVLCWNFSVEVPALSVAKVGVKPINSVVFWGDVGRFASASADGNIQFWDATQFGKPTHTHETGVELTKLVVAVEGAQLFCATSTGSVYVYDCSVPEKPARIFDLERAPISALAVSPDGKTLVTGTSTGTIKLWDVTRDMAMLQNLTSHLSTVSDICFSDDGALLATAGFDRSIKIWTVDNLKTQPILLIGSSLCVTDIQFTPDGTKLYSCSEDKTIRVFSTHSEILARRICGLVGRNLTKEEWNKYIGVDMAYEKTCADK